MKVLLINPPPGRKETPIYPLGLAYVAAALRDHDLRGCDLQLADNPEAALEQAILEFVPDVIAVALRNVDSAASYDLFTYFPSFEACVRHVRHCAPDTPIIVGGPGFSLFPERIMERVPAIDFGVMFEGEESCPQLLRNMENPGTVPGICYRRDGAVLTSPPPESRIDFPTLGPPDRAVFPVAPYVQRGAEFGVQTKRGCAFHCVYCTYPHIDGHRVRARRVEDIAEEMEQLAAQGVRRMFFCDSIFNCPASHAEDLCREILRRGIRVHWRAYFNEKFTTPDLPRLAKEAGCDTLIFGPDAGHNSTLEQYRKGMTCADLMKAYELCRRAGAAFRVAFMINGPGERPDTLLHILWTILVLRLRQRLLFSLTTIRIYPNTELQRIAVAKRLIRPDDDLLRPVFFDPYPMKLLSAPLNLAGRLMYRWTQWRKSRAAKTK